MRKKIIDWWAGSVFSPVAEYQAVLDRATALGYTKPSTATQVKQNALVVAMKAASAWSTLNLFYCFNGQDANLENFSKINWIAPSTFELSPQSSPTYGVNGWTGNGSNAYLNTGWDPTNNAGGIYTLNSASAFAYVHDNVNEAKNVYGMGNTGSSRLMYLIPSSGGNALYATNKTGTRSIANALSVGFFMTQRLDASTERLWKDGALVDTNSAAPVAISTNDMYILSWNNNGTAANFTTRTVGCFGIGAALAGAESALYTAWNTYRTSL